MEHVVMFSGGVGSWAAAKRVVARFGSTNVTLLFADTLIEDDDLYRFLRDAAENVGARLVRIADGRTPWQVYRDERFIGNSRADPCSKLLKRVPAAEWLAEHRDPKHTVVYLGIDWTEKHRFTRVQEIHDRQGWAYEAPMCDPPYLTKNEVFGWLATEGIKRPRLYDLGFAHNNCGGFCCKAGQGHFARLLLTLPDRYAEHEAAEEELRRFLNRDVAVMADRRGGTGKRPMSLREFRIRTEKGQWLDSHAIGGCGCFSDVTESEDST